MASHEMISQANGLLSMSSIEPSVDVNLSVDINPALMLDMERTQAMPAVTPNNSPSCPG
jgi:hypothetical protein